MRAVDPRTIPLTTYEEARPWAASIKEEVLTRRMPMWKAARGYGDFANDPSLSPFEIALIAAWADGGAPEISDRDKTQGAKAKTAIPVAPAFTPPSKNTRVRRLDCGDQPLTGRLLGGEAAAREGIVCGHRGGAAGDRREIVAWIRDFDPQLAGHVLAAPADRPCLLAAGCMSKRSGSARSRSLSGNDQETRSSGLVTAPAPRRRTAP